MFLLGIYSDSILVCQHHSHNMKLSQECHWGLVYYPNLLAQPNRSVLVTITHGPTKAYQIVRMASRIPNQIAQQNREKDELLSSYGNNAW